MPRFARRRVGPPRAKRRPARRSARGPVRRRRRGMRRPRNSMARRITGNAHGIATSSLASLPTNHSNKLAQTSLVRNIKRIGAPNVYLINTSGIYKSSAGLQNYTSFEHIGSLLMNGIRTNISSAATAVAARFVLEDYQSQFMLTNCGTNPIEVDIYDVQAKRVVPPGMTYNQGGLAYVINGDPTDYWAQGATIQAQGAPASQSPAQFYSSSPFDSQLFRDYFVVKKRTLIALPQGATHRHEVLQKPNYMVDDAWLKNNAQNAEPGLTAYTMFVLKGYPLGTGVGDVPPTPTLAPSQISIVQATRVKYTWVQDFTNSVSYANNLSASTYPLVNIGSGVIDAAPAYT